MRSSKDRGRRKVDNGAPRQAKRSRSRSLIVLALFVGLVLAALAWRLTRDDPQALSSQGQALLETDPERAGELLERAVAASGHDHPEAQLLLCEAYGRQGRWLEALGCLSLIKNKGACDPERALALAQEALGAREILMAEHALAAAREAGAAEVDLLKTAIGLHLAVRDEAQTLADCERLAELAPSEALPHIARARILRGRYEILEAIEAYRQALDRTQDATRASELRRELVDLLIAMRDGDAARRELDRIAVSAEDASWRGLASAQVLRLEGKLAEALQQVEARLAESPGDVAGLLLRGTIRFELEEFGQASRDFEQVTQLNPYDKEAHYKLGQALLRQNRIEEGNKHLEIGARLTAQTQEILALEKQAAREPANEAIREKLRELYRAIGVSRGE